MPDVQPRYGCGIEEYDMIIAVKYLQFLCVFLAGGGG